MGVLIDTSVWIDFFRPGTPDANRRKADLVIGDVDAVLCEPILFELMRAAPPVQRRKLGQFLDTFNIVSSPATLWTDAIALGQRCRDRGLSPRPLDLLIASLCITHKLLLVTFDQDFKAIADAAPLRLERLERQWG